MANNTRAGCARLSGPSPMATLVALGCRLSNISDRNSHQPSGKMQKTKANPGRPLHQIGKTSLSP
eukprot:2904302-Amphidinium_carterae.1